MISQHLYNTIGKIDHLSNSVIHAWHSDFTTFVKYATIKGQIEVLIQLTGETDMLEIYNYLRRDKNYIVGQFQSNFKKN